MGQAWSHASHPGGGRSRRRFSITTLIYKPGERSRLTYRPRRDNGRRDLQIVAHTQLGGPIVLVWDNRESQAAPGGDTHVEESQWQRGDVLPVLSAYK
ncbi:hypothetical protein ACFWM5_17925 [Streptomyces bobili]|uniref:hypothetical protein n=1 Tax=Streptomyces bobili TaxID=67280 RepID=UPI0036524B96